jgi:phosphoribosylformylglycinamidine synthase
VIPVKNGEGAYFAPPALLEKIERHEQVVLRYAPGSNPNGSVADIAGVSNRTGNVMGLMPHPEHAVDALRGSEDGTALLGSLVDAARDRMLVAAPS